MPVIVPPSLLALVTPSDEPTVLALELSIAQQLSLPITAWQPVGAFRTLFAINANIASTYSQTVSQLAQGGYASYAALMTDANGNPITSWLNLRGVDQYNVARIPASLAAGPTLLDNASTSSYPYTPDSPLRFQYTVTGATYTSVGSGTIAASTSAQSVQIVADPDWIGAAGTVPSGQTLVLISSLAGVTCESLTQTLAGFDEESNAHYFARCQLKLGSLSPNGPAAAYAYVVESLPQFNTTLPDGQQFTAPTAQNPYGVTAPITRAGVELNYASGIVQVYVANGDGAVAGCADLPIINVTWSTGTATVTTAGAHDLSIGSWAIISGVLGATGVNNQIAGVPAWQCVTASGSTFTFALATNPGTYTSGGSVDGGDLGMANAAVQAQVVPDGSIALVQSADTLSVDITASVYVKTTAGITSTAAIDAIEKAVDFYFSNIPVGGVNAESNGIVPWSELLTVISTANPGTISVQLTVPSADVVLAATEVPVRGATALTVVYV